MNKSDDRPCGLSRAYQLILPLLLSCGVLACGGEQPAGEIGVVASALNTGWGNCPAFDDYQICLCEAENLLGYCQIYGANPFSSSPAETGFYSSPQAFAPLREDKMSSGALGGFTGLTAWPEPGYHQTGLVLIALFSDPPTGQANTPTIVHFGNRSMNDKMSSFTAWNLGDRAICQGGAVPARTAAIYEAIDYGGSCAVLRVGKYPHPAWAPGAYGTKGNFGISNDTLTSIRVGPNTTIRLWDAGAQIGSAGSVIFSGRSTTFTTNQPDVSPFGWNDKTSAIEVF